MTKEEIVARIAWRAMVQPVPPEEQVAGLEYRVVLSFHTYAEANAFIKAAQAVRVVP